MIPLAITSTAAWTRRLGEKRWQLMHRLVYLIGPGGGIHSYWLVQSDIRLPVLCGAILGVLLAYRWFAYLRSDAQGMYPCSRKLNKSLQVA
jgi:methionine sulfoxide reductase heme-binding subunit